MSKVKELSAAQRARKNLAELRKKLHRTAGKAPVVEDLLPAIPGDDIAKLQVARQGKICNVIVEDVQLPPGAQPGDTLIRLMKDGIGVSPYVELPASGSFILELPATETATPGIFRLLYETVYASNAHFSPVSEFFIDTVAPNHGAPGQPATPPVEVVDGVITREILDDLIDIVMTIPAPDDLAAGDICTGFLGKSFPGIPVSGGFTATDDLTRLITITVPGNLIRMMGDGKAIFYVQWKDRSGNIGQYSLPLNLEVQLTPVPSGLLPPKVPANDDGKTDFNDCYPTLGVVIPVFENGLPGDQIRVHVDGKAQPLRPSDGKDEIIVNVPFADLKAGGDGERDVVVRYEVVRAGVDYPEQLGTTITFDIRKPGPDNPNPDPDPGIGNPALLKVVVTGASGGSDNTLIEADVGSPATAKVQIYAGSKAGDLVDLYWNEELVPAPGGRYTVTGSEDPTDEMTFSIASSIFEASGNGFKKVHYVITNPTDNGDNENPSTRTEVDVYISPVDLPAPEIQNLYTNPVGRKYLDCSSIRDIPVVGKAAVVRVAGGGSLTEGLELSFIWSGEIYPPQTPPDLIVPHPIPKKLQGNEHISGFDIYLPFNAALRPIKDGMGTIVYTASIDGRTHTSLEHSVRVVVIDTDGGFCPGTRGDLK